MATRFENFLEKHRTAVIAACTNSVVVVRPNLSPAEATQVTTGIIGLYYDLALGRAQMTEADTQRRVVALRGGLLDPTDGRRRTNGMCDVLRGLCNEETGITDIERGQIQRMIEQTRIFLITTAIPVRSPDETPQ